MNATPLIAGDVVVVGAAHRFSGSPKVMNNARDTSAASMSGPASACGSSTPFRSRASSATTPGSRMVRSGTATPAHGPSSARTSISGSSTFPSRCRPAITTAAIGPVNAVRREPRRAGHQDRQAQVALPVDAPRRLGLRPAVRADPVRRGPERPPIKALAQPTKQAFLFVLNRETGQPIWPIEERPVPQSTVPKERTSPTQPFPTKPPPFDRQGVSVDDLIDFTPALRAEALELVKRYQIGPLYTPPVAKQRGRTARDHSASGRHRRRELARRRRSTRRRTACSSIRTRPRISAAVVPADPATSDFGYVAGQARGGAPVREARPRRSIPMRPPQRARCAWRRRPRRLVGAGPAAHQAALRSHHRLRHERRARSSGRRRTARRPTISRIIRR